MICIKLTHRLFSQNYRDAGLSTLHLTLPVMFMISLKLIEQYTNMPKLKNQKENRNINLKMNILTLW